MPADTVAPSIAYSTDSAGMHPSHTLPTKLRAIAEAGFTQVELAFPDLETYAEQEHPGYGKLDECGKGSVDVLLETAGKVRLMCEELGMVILVIHPCVIAYLLQRHSPVMLIELQLQPVRGV